MKHLLLAIAVSASALLVAAPVSATSTNTTTKSDPKPIVLPKPKDARPPNYFQTIQSGGKTNIFYDPLPGTKPITAMLWFYTTDTMFPFATNEGCERERKSIIAQNKGLNFDKSICVNVGD